MARRHVGGFWKVWQNLDELGVAQGPLAGKLMTAGIHGEKRSNGNRHRTKGGLDGRGRLAFD